MRKPIQIGTEGVYIRYCFDGVGYNPDTLENTYLANPEDWAVLQYRWRLRSTYLVPPALLDAFESAVRAATRADGV
jgi:hypothetical protein